MKISDYISVFSIAIAGTILAYFLMNSFLGNPKEKTVSFEYLEAVDNTLISPSSEVFNSAAINPTVEVYVGSCKDLDGNGVLDDAEKMECGQATQETSTGVVETETLTDEENEEINRAEGYAPGTTREQRESVENAITQSRLEQQQQYVVDEEARRETTSTGE